MNTTAVHRSDAHELRSRIGKGMRTLGIGVFVIGMVLHGTSPLGTNMTATYVMFSGWMMGTLGWAIIGAFENLAIVRLIQDLPTTKIRSAPQGYVELRGVARSTGKTVTCPKCKMSCLWFQYYTGGKNNRHRVAPAGNGPGFVLDDGTGRCHVLAQGSELYSSSRREQRHAHICAGDPLHVLGEFRTGGSTLKAPVPVVPPSGAAPRDEEIHRKLLALKYDTRRMGVFDVNRDGRLDERELQAARRVIEKQAEREPVAPAPAPVDSVIQQPSTEADRLPFLIFVGTEQNAISSVRWTIAGRALLAVVVGLFGLLWITNVEDSAERRERRLATRAAATATAAPAKVEAAKPRPQQASPARQAYDLYRAGKYEEAIAAYDALIEQEPDYADHYLRRGFAHGKAGNDAQAREDIQKCCDLGDERGCQTLSRFD